jgi:hypothetical protein
MFLAAAADNRSNTEKADKLAGDSHTAVLIVTG